MLHLELKSVRVLAAPKTEHSRQVGEQEFLIGVLLNSADDEFVDRLLVLFPIVGWFVLLLLLAEDITLLLLGALVAFPLEVLVVNVRRQLEAREIDLGGGGDYVVLAYPSQWATVDEEWA